MLRWLRRLVCPDPDTDDGQALVAPGTTTRRVDGDPTAHITLRQTPALTDRHGRIPEEMAAAAIVSALALADLGAVVTYGFESVDVGTEQAACTDDDARDRYEDLVEAPDSDLQTARDANILLTNVVGGGCAQWWDKRTAAVGGRGLAERRAFELRGDDRYHHALQALLHELGHCLGSRHDHDTDTPGRQYPGTAWIYDGVWYFTPTVYRADGTPNRCGEAQPDREAHADLPQVTVHEYHDCAVELFRATLRDRGD